MILDMLYFHLKILSSCYKQVWSSGKNLQNKGKGDNLRGHLYAFD